MCKQNNFQLFLLFAIEMAVLSVFSQKEGLGPLGVNPLMPAAPNFGVNNTLKLNKT